MPRQPYRQRKRNLYDARAEKPFRLSRSKLELFTQCPRCFYLDRCCGLGRPEGPPFTLNNVIDRLMKREFDHYRALQQPHPCVAKQGLHWVPLQHPLMETWRDALHGGVTYIDPKRRLEVTGGIDDVWVGPDGRWAIVDYKATGVQTQPYVYADYRRQLALYAWLLARQGGLMHEEGFLVYATARADRSEFSQRLDFDLHLLSARLDLRAVDRLIEQAWTCLNASVPPNAASDCHFCAYGKAQREVVSAEAVALQSDNPLGSEAT